jgi:uncharacterized protein (DUF433 family)
MSRLTETLLHELETAPEPVQQEVLDFLLFIKVRNQASARGVEQTPGVCGGDACVAGTRIPVWAIEQGRRLGFTDDELLATYPTLRRSDFPAIWSYVKSHLPDIEKAIQENEQA